MKVPSLVKTAVKDLGLRRPLKLAASRKYREIDRMARPIAAAIKAAGYDKVCEKHKQSTRGYKKYLEDFDWNIEYVVQEMMDADVLDAPPMRVLDIGSGPGYFLFALRERGHDILGLDLDCEEIFNDLIAELKIPRVVSKIEAMTPMPDLGAPFDMITALGIAFDNHRTEDIWGPKEWEFFLKDCANRLKPGGKIFIRFNPATTRDFDFLRDDVAAMLRRYPNGKLSESKEFFTYIKPK